MIDKGVEKGNYWMITVLTPDIPTFHNSYPESHIPPILPSLHCGETRLHVWVLPLLYRFQVHFLRPEF